METTLTAPPSDLVTVTVNGVERKFPKGKNLLAALLDNDTYVPHYCWHPSLSISGNCRLCLVEIEGQPRPNVSCNMTCTEGLKIKTEGPMVEDCRKGMMEFLLVNHPLDCPICDRGGECMLQRYSMEYGTGTARTTDERRRFEKPQFDPLIDIERNRCIMCTRCVRFMDEVAGEHTLAVIGRGNRNYIGTFGDGPVSSNFSGNIVDICPVGCLTSKPFRFNARAWELQQVVSTCNLCSAGCPTTTWLRDGKIMRVTPPARRYNGQWTIDEDTTLFICNEGRYGNYYANSPDRLLRARVRDGEAQVDSTWEAALARAADALKKAAEAGPDRVALLTGARATNEEYYLLSRLARGVLGTNQIDWRLDFTSEAAALGAAQALAASDGDLALLDGKTYGATLVINADLLDDLPVIGLRIKEAARNNRTKLAILSARLDSWISEQAASCVVVEPNKLGLTLELIAASIAGGMNLPAELNSIREAVAGQTSGLIVLGLDTAGGELNGDLLPAALALAKQLGAGWKFLPVFRGRNAKGAYACGAQSDRLPGGEVNADAARNRAAELWGTVKATAQPGASAPEILRRAAAGEIQTLLLHRCDELVHHPQRTLIEQALSATPNVIAIDTFTSWITDRASVVLPGALFFETEGSLASADGTLQSLNKGNNPPGDAQEDWRILVSLIQHLGAPADYKKPADIFKELLACLQPPRAFSLDDLKLEGPGTESPQRPQSSIRKKSRPDFKLQFSARPGLAAVRAEPAPTPANKLRLLWHTAIQGMDHLGSRSAEFDKLRPEPTLELNPADAQARGLHKGDRVRATLCRTESIKILINPSLPQGLAYGAANVLGLEIPADQKGLPQIEITRVGE